MSNTEESKDPADDLRLRGNFEFSNGNYDAALSLYTAGLEQASKDHPNRVLLLCNRSATFFHQEQYEQAEQDAEEAWSTSQQQNVKAAFRLAKTQMALKKFEAAKQTIQAATKLIDEQQQDDPKQRKAFDDLWQQVLNAAYEQHKQDESPKPPLNMLSAPCRFENSPRAKLWVMETFLRLL